MPRPSDPIRSYFNKLSAVENKLQSMWLDVIGVIGANPSSFKINPSRVDKIKSYPGPADTAAVKRFLGMTGYVRKFIKDYAQLVKPLTKLTEKGVQFIWSNE